METEALEIKEGEIVAKIEKLERRAKLIKEKKRRIHTKRLIEVGSLAEKAGLFDLDSPALLGSFLEIKGQMKNPSSIERWRKSGEDYLGDQKEKGERLIVSFKKEPSQEELKILKDRRFRLNPFRNEWYGIDNKEMIENLFSQSGVKIETAS